MLSGKLKIASASTGKYIIPYYLTEFLNNHPNIDFDLDVSNRDQVISDLLSNQIDFAFISLPLKDSDTELEEVVLLKNELHLFSSSKIQKIDFKTTPIVLREKGSATRHQTENFILENNIQTQKMIQLTSNEAVKQMVCSGYGCSIMPMLGMKYELENNIVKIHPMKGLPLETQWRIVWLKQKRLSPVARGFLKFIQENKMNIAQRYFDIEPEG